MRCLQLFSAVILIVTSACTQQNEKVMTALPPVIDTLHRDILCDTVIETFFEYHGIYIPNEYVIIDSAQIRPNIDTTYLFVVLSPKVLEELDFTNCDSLPSRTFLQIMNLEKIGYRTILKTYGGLISNIGGALIPFTGVQVKNNSLCITHEKGNNYGLKYQVFLSIDKNESFILKIDSIKKTCYYRNLDSVTITLPQNSSAALFSIDDSISVNGNCDSIWESLSEQIHNL